MKKLITGLLFLTILATGCMPKNTVKLEYKYNPGEVLKYKITLNNSFVVDISLPNILVGTPLPPPIEAGTTSPSEVSATTTTQPVLNKKYEIDTRLELLCIKNVKNITPDGIITIEQRFEPLSEETLVDKESTLLEGCSVSDILRDKILTVRLTTSGNILSIEGRDELLMDAYNRASLLGMDETSRSKIRDILRYEIEQIIQQSTLMFPEGKLTKEDTWQRQTISSLPIIGIKSTVTHTDMFEGFEVVNEGDCAEITGSITSSLSNEKPELPHLIGELANKITQQGLTYEMKINGAERGTTLTYFAHKEGKLIKNQILKEGFVNVTAPLMMGSVTSGEIGIKMTTNTKYVMERYKE